MGSSPGSSRVADVEALPRGATVGRYVVLEHIGAGGMGVVYAAYDPDLDRKVALKVLRSVVDDARGAEARARLLREGQAMARVRHPNVIAVHDVGTHEQRVFIAMEFIDGGTLADWLVERRRERDEILEVFAAAGMGLAAAHRSGMIHRDFKPENVLIGPQRRVCVVDFGLARRRKASVSHDGPIEPEDSLDDALTSGSHEELDEGPHRTDGLSLSITRTGAMLGTPAYMAPEQHLGLVPGAAADQFAFCVALYEALYGERPFEGDSPAELLVNVTEGEVRPPSAQARVPGRLRRIILRGLDRRPQSRWPDMETLLGALSRSSRPRSRWWVRAGVALAVVAGGLGTMAALRSAGPRCVPATEAWEGLWDDAAKARYSAAFMATGKSFAEQTWHAVQRDGDAYVEDWVEQHRQACIATHEREEQSLELLELRNACLDTRRERFSALAELFTDADGEVVTGAVDAMHSLPSPDDCEPSAVQRAEARLPSDPALHREAQQLRQTLGRVRTLVRAHRLGEARGLVIEALERAKSLGVRSVEGEALLVHSDVLEADGDVAGARSRTHAALLVGESIDDDRLAAEAWLDLLWLDGYLRARHEAGHDAADHARVLLERSPWEHELRVLLESRLGDLLYAEGRYEEARERHEVVLRAREERGEELDPQRADSLTGMALCELELGRYDEALDHMRRAEQIFAEVYGEGHPYYAGVLTNLGMVHDFRGEYEQALAYHQRSLALNEVAYEPGHPAIAEVLNNYAGVLFALGRHAEAQAAFERAYEIWRARLGERHPDLAMVSFNLGLLAHEQGDRQRARDRHAWSLDLRQETLGASHPDVAASLMELSMLDREDGELETATARLQRALQIWQQTLGPQSEEARDAMEQLDQLANVVRDVQIDR